ncbi:MAG: 4Fe-4S double cluster binding domain-containing protein [Ilumatobacteraceae bacterium]
MADALRAKGWRAAVYADDNAVVDRAVAQRAGLGWYGKNANLLLPKAGSWFVLGCVATDAPIESDATPVRDGCGACTRCFAGCPTDAIPEAGVIDASRCLAWLLQKPGVFPRRFRRALGSRIYGCDDCQEVCPVNERFATARRDDEVAGGAFVSVLELLALDDEALRRRNGQWYLFERDPRWLRRNALIVLGNLLADDAGEGVASADRVAAEARLAAAVADPDPIVRAHAIWAARRAGFDHLVPDQDLDPVVAAELVEGDGVESVDVIPTRRQWERR